MPARNVLFRFCAAIFFAGAGFAAANDAGAQEATVIYGTTTPNVVSVTSDGYIIYKATVAGTMTATVIAVAGTVAGGNFAPRPINATGQTFLTLRGLDSCGINNGCLAFGLENAADANARLAALIAMSARTVTMFAASGANLNEHVGGIDANNGLLFLLAAANKPGHVSVFVSAGANLHITDRNGWNFLHWAVNNAGALAILLSAGANPDARTSSGTTPLQFAIANQSRAGVTILLSAGANVNAADNNGYTPLHEAATDFGAAITILLSAGANVNAANNFGQTPLDLAFDAGADPEAAILTANGGRCGTSTDSRCPSGFSGLSFPAFNENPAKQLRRRKRK